MKILFNIPEFGDAPTVNVNGSPYCLSEAEGLLISQDWWRVPVSRRVLDSKSAFDERCSEIQFSSFSGIGAAIEEEYLFGGYEDAENEEWA